MHMEYVILFVICVHAALIQEASAKLNITVTTNPSGPIYKAGSLYEVICNVSGGSPPYEYEWSVGCTSTNDFITDSVHTGAIIGPYITTSLTCLDVHRCRVTDSSRIKGVGEYIIESVKDIVIQMITGPNSFHVTQNISILTVNESGRFLDIVCTSGLKKPSIGTWILPNNTYITQRNEVLLSEKGGGVIFPGYTTLKLRDNQSLGPGDTGLYTCVIPDINMIERESHIWILQEQVFEPSHPEYFDSYSSSKGIKLNCAFSTKPGEIMWVIGGETLSTNASFTVSQRLLNVSSALYEGSLDIFDSSFMSGDLILHCVLRNIVIGNRLPLPRDDITRTRHYFIQGIIGKSRSFICSFTSEKVTSIQVYSRGEILMKKQGREISFQIELVEDSTHNREYSCIGLVPGGTSQYFNSSIVALIPSYALKMHIGDIKKVVLAGESLIVDLSAIKLPGFTNNQVISCTNQFGSSLSEIDGFDYPENPVESGLTRRFKVPVKHVKLSHAGLYICTAFLETPSLLDNISDTNITTITVKIPSPVVNMSKPITVVQTGAVATVTCSATLNTTYLDLPVRAVFEWMIGGTSLPSNDRFQLDSSATEVGSDNITYHSVLIIAPVTPEEDESILECRVFITEDHSNVYILDSITVNTSVDVKLEGTEPLSSTAIQIRITGLETQCSNWISQPTNDSNINLISGIIVEAVSDRCNCPYSVGYITNEHFLCSDESSTYVTYRALIYGTNEAKAETLAGYVQDYVSMGGDSNLNITIDSNCGALIISFNDSLCDEFEDDIPARGFSSMLVIAVTVAAGGLAFILFLSVVLIIALCVPCKKKQRKCDRGRSRPSPVQNINVPTLSNKAYGRAPSISQPRPLQLLPVISEPRETKRVLQGTDGQIYLQGRPKIFNVSGKNDNHNDNDSAEYDNIQYDYIHDYY